MLKNNWRQGEVLTADFCNEVARILNKLQNITGAGGIQVRYSSTGVSISNLATPALNPLWAVITDGDGQGKYSWVALSPVAGTLAWQQDSSKGSGLYSDASGWASEQTGFKYVPYGIPVELYPASGADPSRYTFVFPGDVVPATINTFTANGTGTATITGGTQIVDYTDLSGGNVGAGTACTLSYLAGSPTAQNSAWLLVSTGC